MATIESESKKNDETNVTQEDSNTTQTTTDADADTATATTTATATAASTADATAYYQQYYAAYGYYPYNYNYGYNQYDPQYYQQYYQQQQQQQTATNDTTNTMQTDNTSTNQKESTDTNMDKTEENNNDTIIQENDENDENEDDDIENDKIITSNTKDLMEWSHFEVSEWVQTVNNGAFAEHAQKFIDNEIDGKVLFSITPQQLQLGLYMKNMIKRLTFHELIQKLKQNTSNHNTINMTNTDDNNSNEFNQQNTIKSITELQKAPPIKKKKKKKKGKKKPSQNADTSNHENGNMNKRSNISATATFLKLSAKHSMQNNKTSSQLLMEKMNKNNKRRIHEINSNSNISGIQHRIEWEYNENKRLDDMIINLNDRVLFEWQYTKNVWKFVNKDAFNENNFNISVAEQLCGSDCNNFVWKPKKMGSYYFGCQVANCATSGNMKVKINVQNNDTIRNTNPNKKQKIK